MMNDERIKKLSADIVEFQKKLNNVLQIFGEQGKPGEKAAFKKKIPATLDFRGWKADCAKCTDLTRFERVGDFIEIEGTTLIPTKEELNPQEGSIATRVMKGFELYIGEDFNNPYFLDKSHPTGIKLEMNPLYRYVTFQVIHDVDLT